MKEHIINQILKNSEFNLNLYLYFNIIIFLLLSVYLFIGNNNVKN